METLKLQERARTTGELRIEDLSKEATEMVRLAVMGEEERLNKHTTGELYYPAGYTLPNQIQLTIL
jgi:hypothetical protein